MKKHHTHHPMALPSRLSLWMGVAFFIGSFWFYKPALAVIGTVFILGGLILWLRYHPNPWKLPKNSQKNFNLWIEKLKNRFSTKKNNKKHNGHKNLNSKLENSKLEDMQRSGQEALTDLKIASQMLEKNSKKSEKK